MLNIMEMWERLAYYGMRVVVPIYIMQADEPGGLHFTPAEKGTIYAGWAVMQSLLPIFTGGYADRYGYKLTIFVSITIKIIGYVLMATQTTYTGFFIGALTLAAGTAIFKPGIQGTIAQTLHKENSSLGWSLFYQLVNIGAFVGPFLAHTLKGYSWPSVFYGCAVIVSLNYLMLLTYKDYSSGSDTSHGFAKVFGVTIANIWPFWFVGGRIWPTSFALGAVLSAGALVVQWSPWVDSHSAYWLIFVLGLILMTWLRGGQFQWQLRLPALILILAGFWMMMYQIWDLHPNFIVDWVDSRSVVGFLDNFPAWFRDRFVESTDRGVQISQEHLLNINAFMVMLFVSIVGYGVAKIRRLTCMLAGMICATMGVFVAGWTTSAFLFAFGLMFFSFGEMLTGPKKNEYFALIAPEGKKGLYLGYVNLPIALGQGIGAVLAGWAYGNFGEKAVLAQKYIAEHLRGEWNGDMKSLAEAAGVGRSGSFVDLQQRLGVDAIQATELLWETYQPHQVWYPFIGVGVVSAIALFVFGRMARGWADMDV